MKLKLPSPNEILTYLEEYSNTKNQSLRDKLVQIESDSNNVHVSIAGGAITWAVLKHNNIKTEKLSDIDIFITPSDSCTTISNQRQFDRDDIFLDVSNKWNNQCSDRENYLNRIVSQLNSKSYSLGATFMNNEVIINTSESEYGCTNDDTEYIKYEGIFNIVYSAVYGYRLICNFDINCCQASLDIKANKLLTTPPFNFWLNTNEIFLTKASGNIINFIRLVDKQIGYNSYCNLDLNYVFNISEMYIISISHDYIEKVKYYCTISDSNLNKLLNNKNTLDKFYNILHIEKNVRLNIRSINGDVNSKFTNIVVFSRKLPDEQIMIKYKTQIETLRWDLSSCLSPIHKSTDTNLMTFIYFFKGKKYITFYRNLYKISNEMTCIDLIHSDFDGFVEKLLKLNNSDLKYLEFSMSHYLFVRKIGKIFNYNMRDIFKVVLSLKRVVKNDCIVKEVGFDGKMKKCSISENLQTLVGLIENDTTDPIVKSPEEYINFIKSIWGNHVKFSMCEMNAELGFRVNIPENFPKIIQLNTYAELIKYAVILSNCLRSRKRTIHERFCWIFIIKSEKPDEHSAFEIYKNKKTDQFAIRQHFKYDNKTPLSENYKICNEFLEYLNSCEDLKKELTYSEF